MSEEIVVSALPGDVRGAWLRDGELIRLALSNGSPRVCVGDVYLGRVTQVNKALNAAFIDIGSARPGFLMVANGRSVDASDKVGEGQAVIVQVVREPDAAKGAKLTARPKLRGTYLDMMPFGSGITYTAISSAPELNAAALEQLRAILPDAAGWGFRPRAADATAAILQRDAQNLTDRWRDIAAAAKNSRRAPCCLQAADDEIVALVRDGLTPGLARVHVDDTETFLRLRASFPDQADFFEAYSGAVPAFAAFAIDEQIEAVCAPVVPLPSGGKLTVAETEALVAIDVDTGTPQGFGAKSAALTANLQAAGSLGRIIQLRDLAGHIVIDFVPLRRKADRAKIFARLRQALADDDRQVDIGGYSSLGLVQLTRERLGPTLRQRVTVPCAHCDGEGRVPSPVLAAGDGLRWLMAEARQSPERRFVLHAGADVAETLRSEMAAAVRACAERLGYGDIVQGDPGLPPGQYRVNVKQPKAGEA